jgi:hypothetical protein
MPINAVLDFSMACLLVWVDALVLNVWLCAPKRAIHDTPEAGRLSAFSHSVEAAMSARRRFLWFTAVLWLAWVQFALADGFTEKVVAVFQKIASDLRVTVKQHNELQIHTPTGPLALYLDNIRAACTSNPTNCDAELESFVGRIASVARL